MSGMIVAMMALVPVGHGSALLFPFRTGCGPSSDWKVKPIRAADLQDPERARRARMASSDPLDARFDSSRCCSGLVRHRACARKTEWRQSATGTLSHRTSQRGDAAGVASLSLLISI